MLKFSVKTRFIFEGSFFVHAESKRQAKEYIEKQCGLVLNGNIHSTLSGDIADWDFPMHPKKQIGRIKEMEKVMYKCFPYYLSDLKKRKINARYR